MGSPDLVFQGQRTALSQLVLLDYRVITSVPLQDPGEVSSNQESPFLLRVRQEEEDKPRALGRPESLCRASVPMCLALRCTDHECSPKSE